MAISAPDLIKMMVMGKPIPDAKSQVVAQMLAASSGGGGAPPAPPIPVVRPPAPAGPPTNGIDAAAAASAIPTASPAVDATMPTPVADAYKSPPDLVAMYTKLMDQQRSRDAFTRGTTLIAAGLAQDQNKQSLIDLAGKTGVGGAGSGAISIDDLINLQKLQTGNQLMATRNAQLPGLMKQYGLDAATVQYLNASGKLDDVIAELQKPHTQVVENAVDGSKLLIDSRDGHTITSLTPGKPRATEYVKQADGSNELVYSDTKARVSDGKQVTNIGAPPDIQIVHNDADGSNVAIDKNQGGKVIGTVTPATDDAHTLIITRADGSQARIAKSNVTGDISPPKDLLAEQKAALAAINADRKASGRTPMTMEEYMQTIGRSGTVVNIGDDGTKLPAPPAGYAYDINPDTGKVRIYDNGPHMHIVPGSPAEAEAVKTKQATDKEAVAQGKAAVGAVSAGAEKGAEQKVRTQDIDSAIALIDKNANKMLGITGGGSLLTLSPFSNEAKDLQNYVETVRNGMTTTKLQEMRDANSGASGLGSVSDFEDKMLGNALGSLKTSSNDQILKYNLLRIKTITNMVVDGMPGGTPGPGNPKGYVAPTDGQIATALDAIPKPGSIESGQGPKSLKGVKVTKTPIPPTSP